MTDLENGAILDTDSYLYVNQEWEDQLTSFNGKDDNTIYFQKWSCGDGYASGIAHSINGVDEPHLECLINLESLSENGWYFYEINYNERK